MAQNERQVILRQPIGLFYENGKATLLNGLLKQNHEDLANECALIIEETRNRYFGWIMGEHAKNYEGFETTTTGHDLNLRVQPTIHRNRLQMWAQFLGYPGPYPFDISDRVLSFKQWIKERADVNLNPKLADVIRSMGIDL